MTAEAETDIQSNHHALSNQQYFNTSTQDATIILTQTATQTMVLQPESFKQSQSSDTGFSLAFLFSTLFVLIISSAFFSGTEAAMMSINRYRLKTLVRQGVRSARLVLKLLENPSRFLSVVLLGNNFVNIMASSVATIIGLRLAGNIGIGIATGILTFVMLLFAEVVPKTIAVTWSEPWAKFSGYAMLFLTKLLFPLVYVIQKAVDYILWALGMNKKMHGNDTLHVEDVKILLASQTTYLSPIYREMMISILNLEKRDIEEIQITRNKLYGIDINLPMDEIKAKIIHAPLDYIVIYEKRIDNFLGILSMIKALSFFDQIPSKQTKEHLKSLLQKPAFVPETANLFNLLLGFSRNFYEVPVAMVVDEYGQIEGMATQEILMNEIVGTMSMNSESYVGYQEKDDEYVLFGSANLHDINKKFHLNFPTDGPNTLNGFLIEMLEGFPKGQFCLKTELYQIEALSVKGNKVMKVRLKTIEQ